MEGRINDKTHKAPIKDGIEIRIIPAFPFEMQYD